MPGDIVDRIDHAIGQTFSILVLVFGLLGIQEAANLKIVETELIIMVGAAVPLYHAVYAVVRAVVAKLRS